MMPPHLFGRLSRKVFFFLSTFGAPQIEDASFFFVRVTGPPVVWYYPRSSFFFFFPVVSFNRGLGWLGGGPL